LSGGEAEAPLAEAIAALLGERPESLRAVAGGDINDAFRAELPSGESVFVKTRPDATAAEYEAEAAGLRWLGEHDDVAVPEVLAAGAGGAGPALLALSWVEPGRLSACGAEQLGRGLARMHSRGAPAHGYLPGGASEQRLGSLALATRPEPEWPRFYAEQRLAPLAALAAERGALDAGGREAIERVCERIEVLAGPPEPPARLHGDLWGGNVLAAADGGGLLIDPAAQGGHRELDLAMLRLFGPPSERLIAAYAEAMPPAAGHRERIRLWQLQPLLVHAVLFGGGYGAAAARAARSLL
jgi:fructosamine-3-kinase